MKKLITVLVAAAPSIAFAQFYAGASIGQNRVDFSPRDYSLGTPGITESQERIHSAYKLYGGYDFNKYLAVEAGYARLGSPEYRYASGDGVGRAKVKQTSIFAVAKGTLPIHRRFRVFGKLGISYSRARLDGESSSAVINAAAGFPISRSENNSRAVIGAGIEFNVTEKLLLRAEYDDFGKFGDRGITGETKARMTSVGVTYKF